jgi:predicted amino acid-binding ACT domain protein
MKKNRETLEQVLNLMFEEYNRNTDVTFAVKKELSEHGINVGTIIGILNTTIPIQTQSMAVLCLISLALYNATKESKIKPEDYFMPEEIEAAKKLTKETELQKEYVDIEDVKQVAEDQWITTMTYKQVAELYKDKIPQKLYDAMYKYEVEITD